ncbi:MAG: hypothetical protein HYV60_14210 [Planctomycetia bacterium]|nr:hypothetical protein [Planctomycetia bacterium]
MATAGRKPLGTGHVDQLSGSERAKLRLTTILETLRGELKIADACQVLGVCESRFFAMRNEWLQEALELLEPRIIGRPSKSLADPRQRELEQTVAELQQQLHEVQVRRDVDQILANVATASREPSAAVNKKMRANRRRRAR